MWPYLLEGIRLIRNSSICLGIEIFTNALNIDVFSSELVDLIDTIRTSQYDYNVQNIKKLIVSYGKKVHVVDRTKFWPNPLKPVPNSLPAECLYKKSWYFNDEVYACAHSKSLIYNNPCDVQLSTPLKPYFLDELEKIKEAQAPYVCNICISNAKVRRQLNKIRNLNIYDTRISNL